MAQGFRFLLLSLLFLSFTQTPPVAAESIRLSSWHLPLNIPVVAAQEWETFERAFPDDQVSRIALPSGPKQLQALAADQLDIVEGIGAAAFITAVGNGLQAQIIGVNSRSPKAFAIVTRSDSIKKISDLKGKQVAGLRASVVHQLFLQLLGEHKLTEKDVSFFPMPPTSATVALLSGKVDVALLVGYEIRRAEQAGAYVLANGQGRIEGLSLIVARSAFIRQHPNHVTRYLQTREALLKEISKREGDMLPLLEKTIGIPQKDIREMRAWFDFSATLRPSDIRELRQTASYLKKQNLIRNVPEISSLLASQAVRER